MHKQILAAVTLLGFLTLAVSAASVPGLTVGAVSGKAGTAVILPVRFEAGSTPVSSLQFALTLPSGVSDVSVAESPAVKAAGKSVTARRAGNVWKVIVFGLNQDALKSGDLLSATVQIAAGTPASTLNVALSDAVYTDPKGKLIKGSTAKKPGQITVTP